jgi:hypothetical protein
MQDANARPERAGTGPAENRWNALPLDPFPAAAEILTPRRLAQITWAFILLGVVIRSIRYLLRFPLWPDEAYLAHNFLDRGYLDLLRPLDFIQIAPLLYLWVQETILKLFGFSEYTLRLFPFVCSLGSLFLFRHLAGRLLKGIALVLAVGTFAVAYPLVRYAAEVKPYGSDMFVALVLLTFTVEWCRQPQRRRWWWALTLSLPVAVMLSYPAVFIAGGISMAMAMTLWRRGTRGDWLRWGISNAAVVAGLAVLLLSSAGNQMSASGGDQRIAFADTFPPLGSPGKLATFLLVNNTSEAFAYPMGGAHGASTLTTICCITALVLLVRARRFALAALCLVPLVLHFTAAALHCYPYGCHCRFTVYLGPIVCLLTGLGDAAILSVIRSRRWPAHALAIATLGLLGVIGVGTSIRDFLKPYTEECWMHNRDFARWFWSDKSLDAELVCLREDMHERFCAPAQDDSLACVYYCNERIYSERIARREPAQLDRVSRARPLRCVRFRPERTSESDEAAFRQWLRSQEANYELVARDTYPLSFRGRHREIWCVDQVEMYEFVPRDAPLARTAAAGGGSPR